MALIIGAPVHQRGWILEQWFDHLANQEWDMSEVEILFNYGDSLDNTLEVINQERDKGRFGCVTVLHDVEEDHHGERMWTLDRYATMVRLRNDLLAYVRKKDPGFYLSCDTDMLLPPHTLPTLFSHLGNFNGIAPLTFMTDSGELFPNCMAMDGSRQPAPVQTSQQYAVFGTVLMDARLYSEVDYSVHHFGEDLGWARTAWGLHMKMAICPEVKVKHVMNREMLDKLDIRIGF